MSQHYNYLLRNNSTVAGLDYSQVECLQRKRLLAFVNHFVSRTAHFLSTFTLQCDQRLDSINKKICRLENELALLEFKLDSVPHLKNSRQSNVPNSIQSNSLTDGKLYLTSITLTWILRDLIINKMSPTLSVLRFEILKRLNIFSR